MEGREGWKGSFQVIWVTCVKLQCLGEAPRKGYCLKEKQKEKKNKRLCKLVAWLSGETKIVINILLMVKRTDPASFIPRGPKVQC